MSHAQLFPKNGNADTETSQVLRPMSRLGGIAYGRTVEGVEIPRLDFDEAVKQGGREELIKEKVEGQ